jgi:hypothetical protein
MEKRRPFRPPAGNLMKKKKTEKIADQSAEATNDPAFPKAVQPRFSGNFPGLSKCLKAERSRPTAPLTKQDHGSHNSLFFDCGSSPHRGQRTPPATLHPLHRWRRLCPTLLSALLEPLPGHPRPIFSDNLTALASSRSAQWDSAQGHHGRS